MKIAVFSDSHGNVSNMIKAVEAFEPDCAVHLGDLVRDAERLRGEFPALRLYSVAGNCDYSPASDDRLLVEEGGVRIFMTHGHRYGVKLGLDALLNSVGFSGAALGLFGHTHIPLLAQAQGITLFNPGSCGGHSRPTYGQITIENGEFNCEIVEI